MMGKSVFITVGTTRFDQLIETVLGAQDQRLQSKLAAKGYTHLLIQSGNYGDSTGKIRLKRYTIYIPNML